VDENVSPILDRSEVYSGCYARVSLSFYAFNTNAHDSASLVEEVVGRRAEVGLSGDAACAKGFTVADLLNVAQPARHTLVPVRVDFLN
jgi:hypothetical protein